MDKKKIIDFFDKYASNWDHNLVCNDAVISKILDLGGIKEGMSVLDVACGTGVLFTYYISRKADVTGIDISTEMVKIAKSKFPQFEILCGDAEEISFDKSFDAVMIYNAFPHFPSPESLLLNLTSALKNGGRLTVAHGMSMKELEKCHSGVAEEVSLPLPEVHELAKLFPDEITVDITVSDNSMYIVSGIKK